MSRKTKALEFAQEEYNITITGRHVHVTDPMKDYAMEKISKIEKFTDRLIDVNVTMDIQKLDHRVDIILKSGSLLIRGSAASVNMYASIDLAVDKIKEQLLRWKEKLTNHHKKGHPVVDMNVNVFGPTKDEEVIEVNDEIEDETLRRLEDSYRPHILVKQDKIPLKILTVDEAIMKMELGDNTFLIFINEGDRQLKVIYRRKDGNYGIIEPKM